MKNNVLKSLLALALALCLLLGGVAATAEELENLTSNSAVPELYTLVLPKSLQIIDEEAFYGDSTIERVILPNGILEIRSKAFANSGLREINLPETITFIAEDAFDGTNTVEVTADKGTYAYSWAVKNKYLIESHKPTVTVVRNATGHADVTVEAGAVNMDGESETGLYLDLSVYYGDEDDEYDEGASYPWVEINGKRLNFSDTMREQNIFICDNLTVNADFIDSENIGSVGAIVVAPDQFNSKTISVDVAGNVTVISKGHDEEEWHPGYEGIYIGMYDDVADSELNISIGDLTLDASSDGLADAAGIWTSPFGLPNGLTAKINTGSINVFGGMEQGEDYFDDGSGCGMSVYTAENNLTNFGISGDINVTGYHAMGCLFTSEGNDMLTITGDVHAEGSNSATGISTEAKEYGTLSVAVGDDIISKGKEWSEGLEVRSYDNGISRVVVEGNIVSEADSESTALDIFTGDNGTTNVTVAGSVNCKGKDSCALDIYSSREGKSNIFIGGDVCGKGEGSNGLLVDTNEGATANIFIAGILSGDDVAISSENANIVGQNLYVWKVNENTTGEIARVLNNYSELDKDETASTALEQSIWYIVRVDDLWRDKLTVTGTSTYTANGVTYVLAHQDENVTLEIALDEGEELDGIMYNDDTPAEYTRNADGSYAVKMLRGGGMKLSLKLKD